MRERPVYDAGAPDAYVPPAPGDAWFDPDYPAELLSAQYERERRARRPPLVVVLPSRQSFCVDSAYSRGWPVKWGGDGSRDGWNVTGTPPHVTLTPSVNLVGSYHGFITAGVIGPDVEGRKFNAA